MNTQELLAKYGHKTQEFLTDLCSVFTEEFKESPILFFEINTPGFNDGDPCRPFAQDFDNEFYDNEDNSSFIIPKLNQTIEKHPQALKLLNQLFNTQETRIQKKLKEAVIQCINNTFISDNFRLQTYEDLALNYFENNFVLFIYNPETQTFESFSIPTYLEY